MLGIPHIIFGGSRRSDREIGGDGGKGVGGVTLRGDGFGDGALYARLRIFERVLDGKGVGARVDDGIDGVGRLAGLRVVQGEALATGAKGDNLLLQVLPCSSRRC